MVSVNYESFTASCGGQRLEANRSNARRSRTQRERFAFRQRARRASYCDRASRLNAICSWAQSIKDSVYITSHITVHIRVHVIQYQVFSTACIAQTHAVHHQNETAMYRKLLYKIWYGQKTGKQKFKTYYCLFRKDITKIFAISTILNQCFENTKISW